LQHEVPVQVNARIDRFIDLCLPRVPADTPTPMPRRRAG